jgi:uncharacterized protein
MKAERVFVDTNIFLRYLTNDVQNQADAVEQVLQRVAKEESLLITNSMVLAEIIWTLESYYKLSRKDIRDKVLAVLNTSGLEVIDSDLIFQAIDWYAEKNVDFLDAFNASWLLKHGLKSIYTFDQRHFSRLEGITVIVPKKSDTP